MSKLLINEPPLQVLPTLAKAIGLNEAIILQQIHFLTPYGKAKAGHKWVAKTAAEWGEIFPFWSVITIRRALANLRTTGLVEATDQHNKANYDKTLWYRVNYPALDALEATPTPKAYDQNDHRAYDQNDHSLGSDQIDHTNTLRKNNKEEEEENKPFWTSPRQPLTRKGGKPYPAEEGTTDPSAILVAHIQKLIEQPKGLIKKYMAAQGIDSLSDDDRAYITAQIDHHLGKTTGRDAWPMGKAAALAYTAIANAEPAPLAPEPEETWEDTELLPEIDRAAALTAVLPTQPDTKAGRIWAEALGELAQQMTPATFEAWLRDTTLAQLDEAARLAVVAAPTQAAATWLDSCLLGTVRRTLGGILRQSLTVQFITQ